MEMERKMARDKDGKLINSKSCSLLFLFIKVFKKGNDEKANKRLPLRYKDRAC
jgi:hypothetical protein